MLGKSFWPYNIVQFAARIVITMSMDLAILYAKSGLSAITDNQLSLFAVAQLFVIVAAFLADN